VVIISVLFLFVREPEYTQVVSADNILTVEGLTREAQDLSIDVLGDYIYEVQPSTYSFIEPLGLTFDLSQAQFDFDVAVYKYNDDILMWEVASAPVNSPVSSIYLEQNNLGKYTIKEYADVESPDFVNSYDDILLMAPSSTIGYEIGLGFLAADGSVIRLLEKTQLGGCDGIVSHGSRVEMSQLERSARVYVGDVQESVEFLIVARWFVDDNGGCVDNAGLE